MQRFDAKDPAETVTLSFDFTLALGAGETLTGAITTTVAVAFGTDAAPAAILNGAAAFDASNKMVLQSVLAGVMGNDYAVKQKAGTSAGRVLVLTGILPIRPV